MNVDPSAILALISELYATVTRQSQRIAELEQELEEMTTAKADE